MRRTTTTIIKIFLEILARLIVEPSKMTGFFLIISDIDNGNVSQQLMYF
jgi:hypothetical protein